MFPFKFLYFYLCFYCQQSYSALDTQLFDPYENLVDDYRRFMGELGCFTLLCNDNQNQTNITLFDGNNSSNVNNTNCCSVCSCSDDCLRDGNCCPDKLTDEFITTSIYPVGGCSIVNLVRLNMNRAYLEQSLR